MPSEIGSIQPNPYLFNIENRRKRKARLAHEIGAGAKCLKCEDKCPGFQLHFWRKICQNCRCGKDDHEVEEEDEDIGKIVIGKLFERPIRTKEEENLYSYGTDLEMINDSTGQKEKLKFDWIPPGVERAIAKRYMEMLPPEKRPVAGSEAAKERRRQLEQQVPLYDMDESERCELLQPEELQNFLKYLDVLRTRVAGQGSVQEIVLHAPKHPPPNVLSQLDNTASQTDPVGAHSEDFPPPPDSWMNSDPSVDTDNSSAGSRAIRNLENSLNNNIPQGQQILSPKSAFISDLLREKRGEAGTQRLEEPFRGLTLGNKFDRPPTEKPPPPPQEPPPSHAFQQSTPFKSQYTPIQSEFAIPGPAADQSHSPKKGAGEEGYRLPRNLNNSPSKSSVLQLASPKPFIAKSEQRNIQPGQFSSSLVEGRKSPLGKYDPTGDKGGLPAHGYPHPKFAVPPVPGHSSSEGLNENELRALSKGAAFPHMTPLDGRVVSSNAVQAPYMAHKETLIGHGGHSAFGSDVNVLLPQESQRLGKTGGGHSPARIEDTLATGQFTCQYCKHSMKPGDVAVICERAGPGKYWHPKCFVCVTCKELLADLIYFYKDGQVFCGRHYTQAADIPRCKACDELIFGESWTRADNCDWHIHHFCCFICDKPLAGLKYIPDEKEFPHCVSCYMSFKAKMCETCEDKIGPEEKRAGYNGYFYHALPACFSCFGCKTSLMGKRFKMVKNWVFCSQECVNASEPQICLNPNPKKKEA